VTREVVRGARTVVDGEYKVYVEVDENNIFAKKLAEGRKIIAEGEAKDMKSLNEKNKPKEEDWSL